MLFHGYVVHWLQWLVRLLPLGGKILKRGIFNALLLITKEWTQRPVSLNTVGIKQEHSGSETQVWLLSKYSVQKKRTLSAFSQTCTHTPFLIVCSVSPRFCLSQMCNYFTVPALHFQAVPGKSLDLTGFLCRLMPLAAVSTASSCLTHNCFFHLLEWRMAGMPVGFNNICGCLWLKDMLKDNMNVFQHNRYTL